MYIYTHIYIYTHTHTHTYIYIISAIIHASEGVLSSRIATYTKCNSAPPSELHKTFLLILTVSQMNNKNK